jgi:hypothetical protein
MTIILFALGTRKKDALVPAVLPEHRRVGRGVRPQPGHHADDGRRRPPLPAVPDDAVLLHLLQQYHRDLLAVQFPANAVAMPMTSKAATWVIFNVVGIKRQASVTSRTR